MNQVLSRLSIAIMAFILCGCNSGKTKDAIPKTAMTVEPFSMVHLTINGKTKLFRVRKGAKIRLSRFQDFLNRYPTIPQIYLDTLKVDVTGDGIEEIIFSRIEMSNNDYTLYSKIQMGEKVIYADTLKTNNDLAFIDWDSDSIYYRLKPYSTFYRALLEKTIVEDLDSNKINEDLIDFYTSGEEARLKDKGFDSLLICHKIDSVKYELRHYHGKFVLTLDHWDQSLLIWNKYTETLDLLYSP